jgi:hypothetical protein
VLPQVVLINNVKTFQNEKLIPAYFREKTGSKCNNNNMPAANLITSTNKKAGLKPLIYIGRYVDPPDLA